MPGLDVGALMPPSLRSEGPTPGALQELLDNVDRSTEMVRTDLFHHVMRNIATGAADADVLAALVRLDRVASGSGTEQWVAQCANKYLEMQQHVAALQAELKAAQAAADLEATLREFRGCLSDGRLTDAAYGLLQLRKIAEDSAAAEQQQHQHHQQHQQQQYGGYGGYGASPAKQAAAPPPPSGELAALQAACAGCERDLAEALDAGFAEAFDAASLDGGVITVTCALPSGCDVGELWAAAELVGAAERHAAAVADVLLQHVLPHVLAGAAELQAHVAPGGDSAHVRWIALPPGAAPSASVELQCMQLLAVLAEALLRQRPAATAAFGAALWGRFVALYRDAFLAAAAGAGVDALSARQDGARAMEAQALALGLAAPGSDLAGALSAAVRASYHALQQGWLARARGVLAAHDPAAAPAVVGQPLPVDAAFYARLRAGRVQPWEALDPPSGWDSAGGPPLAAGYYPVSATALQLVVVLDDALAHACQQGDPSLARALVDAAGKMAAMLEAMLPAPPAGDAPALALLRHNDLAYAAQHLLLLPFLFGARLEALLGAPLWLGAEAARLRRAARGALADTVAAQASAVVETMLPLVGYSRALSAGEVAVKGGGGGKGGGNKGGGGGDAAADAAAARGAALYTLRRAGRLLWSGLAPCVALDASARLLEPVASALLGDLFSKRDIGADEASALAALYGPLADGAVTELLADADLAAQVDSSSGGSGVTPDELRDIAAAALAARCRGLRRLQAVLGLLEARLADIVAAWEAGALRGAGLSLPEVVRLVRALFEDTDYRAQCLQAMEVAEEAAAADFY